MPAGTKPAASGGGGIKSKYMHSVAILGSSLGHGLHTCFLPPLLPQVPWWRALRTVVSIQSSHKEPQVGRRRSEQPWLEAVSPFRRLGTPPRGNLRLVPRVPHGSTYGVNIKYTPRGHLRCQHQVHPKGPPTVSTSSTPHGATHGVNIEYVPRGNLRREHQVRPTGQPAV